jgi:hypothetical protein
MAERDRLQGCSRRRIRTPKQSGAVSFILFRVRAKVQLVQFRATMTTWQESGGSPAGSRAATSTAGDYFRQMLAARAGAEVDQHVKVEAVTVASRPNAA